MSEQSGYSSVGAPPQTPGLPQNPLPIVFNGFAGLNTKASQQGIEDQQMFVCDGLMPLGKNNLRCLYDLGPTIFTTAGGKTIENFGFGNIGSSPICIVCQSDGSLVQVNTTTLAQTTIGAAGTITAFPPAYSQWGSSYSIIVAGQTNGYWLWDGTNLFTAGGISPQVTVINGGLNYTSAPTITINAIGVAATGSIFFAANPSPGDTVTLNSVVYTFIAGATSGTNIHIGGTCAFTVASFVNQLALSVNPLITVASYNWSGGPGTATFTITYNTTGTIGNAFTTVASVAVPSGPHLTGGVNGGAGATFTGTVANGSLISVKVTNPGNGFTINSDTVLTITGGGSDDMASATPTVSTASGVASVIINQGGMGYSSLTAITNATGTASVSAQFAVQGSNGVITGVTVLNPGLGYTAPPALTVTDLASGAVGTGALITAVMEAGQISSVTVNTGGSGYSSPPTLTVIGDGTGAEVQAVLSASVVGSINVISGGSGYTHAAVRFDGGNNGAAAVATTMPFGVSGTTVETYTSRVWVGNGRFGQISAPGSPSDFNAPDGSTAFQSNDSFLKIAYYKFIQSNGFIYLFGDSSMNYGSGVNTSGSPAITTFSNLNVDPQIGTPWPDTIQAFGRDIVFANPIGVHVSYGGAVTKVSDELDGIYTSSPQANWPAGFLPSAAVMTIYGIKVYVLLMPILDQVTGLQVIKCLMWDGKKWWTSPQTGLVNGFIATQEINSVLTAYCSPAQTTIQPMFTTPTTSGTMTKYLYSKLWDTPGVFTTKTVREWFALINVNLNSVGGAVASGSVFFPANPAINDTVTFNGVVWTFIAGATAGTSIHIAGTCALTINDLVTQLAASANGALTVATYNWTGGPSTATVLVTYKTVGTAGNAYTLAASVATPSGAHLTGGANNQQVFIAPITENGVGNEIGYTIVSKGPNVFGPLPSSESGRLMGIRVRTTTQDIQINTLTLFNQIGQSNV